MKTLKLITETTSDIQLIKESDATKPNTLKFKGIFL